MVTVALNYGEIKSHSEIVLNVKPFTNKYNWKGTNYLSKIDDWKTYEKNNPTMLLIFCILKYIQNIKSIKVYLGILRLLILLLRQISLHVSERVI